MAANDLASWANRNHRLSTLSAWGEGLLGEGCYFCTHTGSPALFIINNCILRKVN